MTQFYFGVPNCWVCLCDGLELKWWFKFASGWWPGGVTFFYLLFYFPWGFFFGKIQRNIKLGFHQGSMIVKFERWWLVWLSWRRAFLLPHSLPAMKPVWSGVVAVSREHILWWNNNWCYNTIIVTGDARPYGAVLIYSFALLEFLVLS